MAAAQTVIFQNDKVLICQTGTERLDISVDKWAAPQSWRDAVADEMPSAKVEGRVFIYLFPIHGGPYHNRSVADDAF